MSLYVANLLPLGAAHILSRVNQVMTMAAGATICPCCCSRHDRRCRRCCCHRHRRHRRRCRRRHHHHRQPLFLPLLPAPTLLLLSANATITFAAAKTIVHIPSATAASTAADFSSSSPLLLWFHWLPPTYPPCKHTLCFCRRHTTASVSDAFAATISALAATIAENFQPAGQSAPAKDGSSWHHVQVSWEREVYFRQYFSILDSILFNRKIRQEKLFLRICWYESACHKKITQKKLKIQKTPFKKNVPVCFFEKSYRSNKLTALVDFTNAGNLPLQD
jgi:hypothetical protein